MIEGDSSGAGLTARQGGRWGRKRRAILHIGTEKTGTTSLQAALSEHRDALAEAGIRYPVLGPQNAHSALALFACGAEDDLFYMRQLSGVPEAMPLREARPLIAGRLGKEVAEHPDATFVLSAELLSSWLSTGTKVARLKRLLDRYFDEIRVICYLRRWDRFATSLYSTYLRNGGTEPFAFDLLAHGMFDYGEMLERWVKVFGRESVDVAIYERAVARKGGLLADFAARAGLPFVPSAARQNEALSDRTSRVLRRVGLALRDCPQTAAIVRSVVLEVPTDDRTMTPLIDPVSAERFVAARSDEAERVRAAFFPDQTALFDDSYVEYQDFDPAAHQPAETDWREVATVLGKTIVALHGQRLTSSERYAAKAAEHDNVSAELAFHRAFIHVTSGRVTEAREAALHALSLNPQATYYRLLAHIDQLRGDVPAALVAIDQALAIDPTNSGYLELRATLA